MKTLLRPFLYTSLICLLLVTGCSSDSAESRGATQARAKAQLREEVMNDLREEVYELRQSNRELQRTAEQISQYADNELLRDSPLGREATTLRNQIEKQRGVLENILADKPGLARDTAAPASAPSSSAEPSQENESNAFNYVVIILLLFVVVAILYLLLRPKPFEDDEDDDFSTFDDDFGFDDEEDFEDDNAEVITDPKSKAATKDEAPAEDKPADEPAGEDEPQDKDEKKKK
ncbi:MAG: hypothetical protein RLY93_02415 [Sumerlaeia bacterium]